MSDRTWQACILRKIAVPLCEWYAVCRRDLPWRRDRDPYHIWVSEIMLQQTRAETVRPYFERFIRALPDLHALAVCPEDRLLKLWEGLGYYSRVRNMQKAARLLEEQGRAGLPSDREALLSLPGIGAYTAGAIASIAFGEPAAAVDGNVLRILSRLFADGRDTGKQAVRNEYARMLEEAMSTSLRGGEQGPGAFNQALMDLGASVCLPNAVPLCGSCPLKEYCLAHRRRAEQDFPVRREKKARRIEQKTVLLVRDGEHVYLRKRPAGGLLAGLYEFPNLDGQADREEALGVVKDMGLVPMKIKSLDKARHIFSHVEWHMTGYEILVADEGAENGKPGPDRGGWICAESGQIEADCPIPSAFAAYAEYLRIHLGTGRKDGR